MTDEEMTEILDNVEQLLNTAEQHNGDAQRRPACAGHRGPAHNPARPGERTSLRLGSTCTFGVLA